MRRENTHLKTRKIRHTTHKQTKTALPQGSCKSGSARGAPSSGGSPRVGEAAEPAPLAGGVGEPDLIGLDPSIDLDRSRGCGCFKVAWPRNPSIDLNRSRGNVFEYGCQGMGSSTDRAEVSSSRITRVPKAGSKSIDRARTLFQGG